MMQQLGGSLREIPAKPKDVKPLPPEIEDQIAGAAAQVSQRLMQQMQQANPEVQKAQDAESQPSTSVSLN